MYAREQMPVIIHNTIAEDNRIQYILMAVALRGGAVAIQLASPFFGWLQTVEPKSSFLYYRYSYHLRIVCVQKITIWHSINKIGYGRVRVSRHYVARYGESQGDSARGVCMKPHCNMHWLNIFS